MLASLRRRVSADLLWPAGLILAVLLIYSSSLSYPFFWVDPIDIGLADSRSIWTIFTNSQGYLYYRPFAFLLWKLLRALSGGYDPFVFHLVQVAMHALNAALFYTLARRILADSPHWLPGVAALFFAWYPSSYQTVTWVISPQVQAMAFLLGSAIAYYDGRLASNRRKIALSLILLAIALPFHENAIFFGFVIAAIEIYLTLARTPRAKTSDADFADGRGLSKSNLLPIAHVAICLTFFAVWLIIPKDPDSAVVRFEPAAGWYLLQGLIWPVAGAVGPWRAWLDGSAWQPLIFAAPITLLFLIVVHGYAQRLRLFALGLVWFGAMVLPIWATRGIDYVGVSPRIFYVAAPGAILIWAGLLTHKLQTQTLNRLWRIGLGLLVALIALQSLVFLAVRKDLQDKAMPAIWDVVRSGQPAGDDARLLYVNAPDQITPLIREYPIGFFRAILMPVSVDLGQYAQIQTGTRPTTRSISVPALAKLDRFPYQVNLRGEAVTQAELSDAIRSVDTTFFTEYYPDGRVRVVEAGSVKPASSTQRLATFDARLALARAEATPEDDRLRIEFDWDCLGALHADETAFVHVLDASGQLADQADGEPLRDLFPLAECRPGETIHDVRYVEMPPGAYTIRVGIYNRVSGERLKAIDANGQPLPDDAIDFSRNNF